MKVASSGKDCLSWRLIDTWYLLAYRHRIESLQMVPLSYISQVFLPPFAFDERPNSCHHLEEATKERPRFATRRFGDQKVSCLFPSACCFVDFLLLLMLYNYFCLHEVKISPKFRKKIPHLKPTLLQSNVSQLITTPWFIASNVF